MKEFVYILSEKNEIIGLWDRDRAHKTDRLRHLTVITVVYCDGKVLIVDSLSRQYAKKNGESVADLEKLFNFPGSGHACGVWIPDCELKEIADLTARDEVAQELKQNRGDGIPDVLLEIWEKGDKSPVPSGPAPAWNFVRENEPVFLDWVSYDGDENVEYSAVYTLRISPEEKNRLVCCDDYAGPDKIKHDVALGEQRWLTLDELIALHEYNRQNKNNVKEKLLDGIERILDSPDLMDKLKARL